MQKTNKNPATIFKILKIIKGKKRYLYALLFINVIQALLSVGYALFFKQIIDSAVSGFKGLMIKNIIGLALLAFIQLALRSVVHFLNEYTKSSVENTLKKHLFSNLIKKQYSLVCATHSGEWLNRLTNDTVVVADGLINIIPGALATVVRMTCAFIFLAFFIPKFALFLLSIGVILICFTALFRKISKKLHIAVQKADGELRVFLTEQLNSLMILKSYGREEKCEEFSEEYMLEHKKKRMKRNLFLNLSSSGFSFVMNAVRVLAALYSGFSIINGVISYGTFTAVIQLLGQVQGPIASISGYAPRYYAMLASAERVFELDTSQNEETDDLFNAESFYNNEFLGFGLRDAFFSYNSLENGGEIAIENLNLDIKKGEFVAFTGHSGCGKSTVLKLFLSLYELENGNRYLSTKSGEIALNTTHRNLFAYVPQGNALMNSTIRDVVAFFDNEKDEKSILNALKIACADEFVASLPDGINTHLGERGAGLSEGEMQRIAIARAICSDRPILLLDESTSALDEETEEKLLRNIKTMTNKTVVIVTHRTKALNFVDRTVNFED